MVDLGMKFKTNSLSVVTFVLTVLASISVSARTVTSLSGTGWTCDGLPVSVPHTWNVTDACDGPGDAIVDWSGVKGGDSVGGNGYLKKRAVYRRKFPAARPGKRYFLKFDGASVNADVAVNGRVVGAHQGAFTAFVFEITDFLKTVEVNELEVAVDNRWNELTQPMSADYSVYGGLYRNVWLIETDPVCIDPMTDGTDGIVVAADPGSGDVTVGVSVLGGTNEVKRFRIENHELWSPEHPKLYVRRIAIDQNGSHDSVDVRFAFRTFEFREGLFYLNGRLRKLRGVNRHQDRAGKGWAVSGADEEEDVRLMKEMGVDALRTAHYPQSRHIYDLCDEKGIICWVEYPNVNRLTLTKAFEDGMHRQVREMVSQCRNHPCVAMWSIFNELYNGESWMRERSRDVEAMMARTRDLIHELDPGRPVVGVMGETGIPTRNAIPDEYGLNVYPCWYSDLDMHRMLDWVMRESGRKTVAISEYGIGASVYQHGDPTVRVEAGGAFHPEEYQAFRMHDNLLQIVRDDRVWGSYVWAMFDFGADNRHEGDRCGINDKGLVTHDRKEKKDAYYLYQANWTKTPVLHLVGSRMTVTTNAVISVMGFSNVGPATLTVNGRELGTKTPDEACGLLWPDVKLDAGRNTIRLLSADRTCGAVWMLTKRRKASK